ncbi:MAG: hypothetical protein HDS30_07405 [Bacteroides sp.]|nr:hypothetical protein [Bacteroides sp.]
MKLQLFSAAALIAACTACSGGPDINGAWTSTPTRIDNEIAMASDATSVLTVDFRAPKGAKSGAVTMSAVINANQPVDSGATEGFAEPYEVSVTATATISGQWTYEDDDHDDIVIFLDRSTLNVNVDPDGVSYSQNLLTGLQQPQVDSLTAATAERWRAAVRSAATAQFIALDKLDDVKVHDNILSCEVGKRDLTFHRSM